MPALVPTDHFGILTWLGHVSNDDERGIASRPLDHVALTWRGLDEDRHAGLTRPACARVKAQHPKGTEIRNVRQLSLLGAEELAAIAADLGLDALDPGWLGASAVISGLPDFTHLPPSSRLQADTGATLVVDMLNEPCHLPAREIEAAAPTHGAAFKRAAAGRRGVTAWVERPGRLSIGARLRLHVPRQRTWRAGA